MMPLLEVGVIMKRAQVFKKNILSAAVITLLSNEALAERVVNSEVQNGFANGGAVQTQLTMFRKVAGGIDNRLSYGRTGINTGDMFESQGFWGQYFYSDGSMDDHGNKLGFDSKINGLTLGIDAELNNMFTAGFAFSYGNTKLTNKGVSGENKSDTYVGAVYGGWHSDAWFANGMLSYAGGKTDLVRDQFKADGVNNSTWGAHAVAGYSHQINEWIIQPQGEFNYASLKMDDFTEKGNGTGSAQSVKVEDHSIFEVGVGLKVFGEYDAGRGVIKPEATFMAYHDFKDDKYQYSYKSLTSAVSAWQMPPGDDREQNRYVFGLGTSYAMDNNLSLGLNYDYNWSGDFKAHGFMARVSYEF